MNNSNTQEPEWIEPDGLGGFASGTVSGIRTRRYHGLLLSATTPPSGRVVLVNGFDAFVETPRGTVALTSQRYAPDVVHPDGASRLAGFTHEPWPRWTWWISEALRVEQELFVPHGKSAVVLRWKLIGEPDGPVILRVRPFLSGRDFHATHHENGAFRFDAAESFERVLWQPYEDVLPVTARHNARYLPEPGWYRNFLYMEECARGLDCQEDLAAPGVFEWDLATNPAVLILGAGEQSLDSNGSTVELAARFEKAERERRASFASPLDRAADGYLVRRGEGCTIIAGYPWFGDWGRDTFIALRGLCIATDRLEEARDILVEWAGAVSEGMLPNRFPDRGETPEFNSVDASLWYVVAVHEYIRAAETRRPAKFAADDHFQKLLAAVEAILAGYSEGTRFGIRADEDGLLACGQHGVQLTWMDARVGDRVVTPRIGKPVEVQALWINALWIGSSSRWEHLFEKARASFVERFWNEAAGGLFDVIDCDHQPGTSDAAIRPNQIFAVGGLPFALLEGDRARRVVETVQAKLLTPLGLRSLAPGEHNYAPRYEGGVPKRDGSYHQGTVWPWLIGPFVEAWLRVGGDAAEARTRFLAPLREHLANAGLGHISEIADAEPPHTARGCPFQAWSLGELLRLDRVVLADAHARHSAQASDKPAPAIQ